MPSVKFSLHLNAPIACSPEDCFYQEQFILPGSMVRGALASLYLKAKGKDEKFDEAFFGIANRFPFLFPSDKTGEPMQKSPKTNAACKRKKKQHGIVSRLEDILHPTEQTSCGECNSDMKPYTGYLQDGEIGLEKYYVAHTAIHPKTYTALPHAYFQELLIAPKKDEPDETKIHFCGYGWLDQESLATFQALCAEFPLMIGKASSRGKGWCCMSLEAKEPAQKRLAFSEDLLTLHCVTPLILLDEFLRPTTKLPLEWNHETLQIKGCQTEIVSIGGWSVVHGLPKVEDTAMEIGSVFLLEKSQTLRSPQALDAFIQEIEKKGLGERKNEGFGQIRINDSIVVKPKEV